MTHRARRDALGAGALALVLSTRVACAQAVAPAPAPAVDANVVAALRTYVAADAADHGTMAGLTFAMGGLMLGEGTTIAIVDHFQTPASAFAPTFALLSVTMFISGGVWLRPGPSVALLHQTLAVGARAGAPTADAFAEGILAGSLARERGARASLAWMYGLLGSGSLLVGGLICGAAVLIGATAPSVTGGVPGMLAEGIGTGAIGALMLATGIYAATTPPPAEAALRVLHSAPQPTIAPVAGGAAVGLVGAL